MPITRGTPDVIGIDPDYPGLLQVHVYLEPTPDQHWAAIFQSPSGYGHPLSMHRPVLTHDRVEMRPPDNEVTKYVEKLDERIRLTNEQWERDVLPQLEAARIAKRTAEETARKRVEDAKRALGETG
jgi:hypothetical protein